MNGLGEFKNDSATNSSWKENWPILLTIYDWNYYPEKKLFYTLIILDEALVNYISNKHGLVILF